jgi:hypothetical protein
LAGEVDKSSGVTGGPAPPKLFSIVKRESVSDGGKNHHKVQLTDVFPSALRKNALQRGTSMPEVELIRISPLGGKLPVLSTPKSLRKKTSRNPVLVKMHCSAAVYKSAPAGNPNTPSTQVKGP